MCRHSIAQILPGIRVEFCTICVITEVGKRHYTKMFPSPITQSRKSRLALYRVIMLAARNSQINIQNPDMGQFRRRSDGLVLFPLRTS